MSPGGRPLNVKSRAHGALELHPEKRKHKSDVIRCIAPLTTALSSVYTRSTWLIDSGERGKALGPSAYSGAVVLLPPGRRKQRTAEVAEKRSDAHSLCRRGLRALRGSKSFS